MFQQVFGVLLNDHEMWIGFARVRGEANDEIDHLRSPSGHCFLISS